MVPPTDLPPSDEAETSPAGEGSAPASAEPALPPPSEFSLESEEPGESRAPPETPPAETSANDGPDASASAKVPADGAVAGPALISTAVPAGGPILGAPEVGDPQAATAEAGAVARASAAIDQPAGVGQSGRALEAAPAGPLAVGDRVEGRVADAGSDAGPAKLTLADGRSVSLDRRELTPEPSEDPQDPAPVAAAVGEIFAAFVVRIDPSGEVWVSRSRGSAALQLLRNARDHNEIVEGRVVAQGPAGLEVDLGGGIFALCPTVEVGDDVEKPGHLVGQTARFRVTAATEREVLLSRRTARESITPAEAERRAEEAAEVRRRLRPGAIAPGRISRLREFGAFVDLGGGVEGLIHTSELAHERVSSPKDVVQVGQPVEVQVLKVDYDAHKGERISLSLKALSQTAWDKALLELKEGDQRQGKVLRLEQFGVFVELAPGVTGLIHVTALGTRRRTPLSEVVKPGDEIGVEVTAIDKEKHRISLKRLLSEAEAAARKAEREEIRERKRAEARAKREETHKKPHERLKAGDLVEAAVDRIEPYGFFLQLKGGGRGMVHVSEMGGPPEGVDAQKPVAEQFPKGSKVRVAVLEIDVEHRIRLSRAAVADLEGGMTAEAYLKHKAQAELDQKLLRSAERPARPPRPGGERRGAGSGAESRGPGAGPRFGGAPRSGLGGGRSGAGGAAGSFGGDPGRSSPRAANASGAGSGGAAAGPGRSQAQGEPRPPPRNEPRREGSRREGGAGFDRRDRPPRREDQAPPLQPRLPPNKGSSMGTLGDLIKAKLQQRKP